MQRLTAREFFDLGLEGGSPQDAAHDLRLAYATVHAIRHEHSEPRAQTARRLEEWSRKLPSAQARGVSISAVKTLGLDDLVDPEEPNAKAG